MFLDEVKIYLRSGNGGDGNVSFRREKFMPQGGPAGGDGGKGGDIIFVVNPKTNTLSAFQNKIHYKADHGDKGGTTEKTGRSGEDIIIPVPAGTVIKDAETGAVLADMVELDQHLILLKGGRGGRGNQHFANSRNQTPRYAERGEPGQERWVVLELKLIADVGIVGVPNAGKSTLLSVISNAKPKIAPYPFTTLTPQLGVVRYDDTDLVFADIPGLIEGAHEGIGLGHEFLRHVQRTRALVHVIDGSSENPLADYSQINTELALYDDRLAQRPQVVAFNKMDLPDAQTRWPDIQAALQAQGVTAFPISAATQDNVRALINQVLEIVSKLPKTIDVHTVRREVLQPEVDDAVPFEITRDQDGAYHVKGHRIERAAQMTHWDNEEAILRFQNILEVLGVSKALEEHGVRVGDTVYIGNYELEWSD
ncbi:MAG: GTPase ObgE [Anaerolineae bacterium]|jgi:GTP-binding protein|nr:GTPase ObgE [Anaerolineae bacterium]